MPASPCWETATKLLFTNLNGTAISAQADVWAALADGGAGSSVATLIIDADAEIIDINGAIFALCIESEADCRRQFQFNPPAYIVDIDISERRFRANRNYAMAISARAILPDL